MTNWYVRQTGNNGNAGTSPGAAWATVGKAVANGAGPAGGDTVYFGAGTYAERNNAFVASPVSELKFVGDVDGSHTGDAGPVIFSAYIYGPNYAPSTSGPTLDLNAIGGAANARHNLTFENIYFIGANAYGGCVRADYCKNLTFRNCVFVVGGQQLLVALDAESGVNNNILFERCTFLATNNQTIQIFLDGHSSADYDAGIVFSNCKFYSAGYQILNIEFNGSGSFYGGGVVARNCTSIGGTLMKAGGSISTSYPCKVENSIVIAGVAAGIEASTPGSITEDYNLIMASNPRLNVTAGAHSVSDYSNALMLELGYSWQAGFVPHHELMPLAGSPQLGFGNASGAPSTDWHNLPRPGTASNAIGILERNDVGMTRRNPE